MQRIITKNWLRLSLIFLVSFGISLTIASAARTMIFPTQPAEEETSPQLEISTTENNTIKIPEFQTTIDSWLTKLPEDTEIGIAIYDLDVATPIASSNANAILPNDNFGRWLISYDGYRQIALGLATAEEFLASDYYAEYSLADCLEANLANNNSVCTSALNGDSARQTRIEALLNERGLMQTNYTAHTTTAYELGEFLQGSWNDPDLPETYQENLHSAIANQNLSDGFTVLDSPENDKTYLIVVLKNKEEDASLDASLEMLLELLKNTVLIV